MAGETEKSVQSAFANQVSYCRANDAPITARVVEAIIAAIDRGTRFGAAILDWNVDTALADALPLRAAGGLHALHLSGAEPPLALLYAGEAAAIADAVGIVANAIRRHDAVLLPWLDGPPQTNEAGRSSNYVAAMLWLADQGLPPRFDCLEIGSSAGINLMIDRYHYDLGGISVGPKDAPIAFAPEWRGPPPPKANIQIVGLKGCDVAPVDLADPAQALRLKAYIWPEHHIRFERLERAIAEAERKRPDLSQGDAAKWIGARLKAPQKKGMTRIVMHSIVWQYLGRERQAKITAAIEAAGARATTERPLAWVALEANRTNFQHELVVRVWPGDGGPTLLGRAHAHGAWVEWDGPASTG